MKHKLTLAFLLMLFSTQIYAKCSTSNTVLENGDFSKSKFRAVFYR